MDDQYKDHNNESDNNTPPQEPDMIKLVRKAGQKLWRDTKDKGIPWVKKTSQKVGKATYHAAEKAVKDVQEKAPAALDAIRTAGDKTIKNVQKAVHETTPSEIKKVAGTIPFDSRAVSIKDVGELLIPESYHRVKEKYNMDMQLPRNMQRYGIVNIGFSGFLIICEAKSKNLLDFTDVAEMVSHLHQTMSQNAGIIEAGQGDTQKGKKYSYHILKHKMRNGLGFDSATEYALTMDMGLGQGIVHINGHYQENGMEEYRKKVILDLMQKAGKVGENLEGWQRDPYDPEYTRGFLMDLSEDASIDRSFQDHPLTQIRSLLGFIETHN